MAAPCRRTGGRWPPSAWSRCSSSACRAARAPARPCHCHCSTVRRRCSARRGNRRARARARGVKTIQPVRRRAGAGYNRSVPTSQRPPSADGGDRLFVYGTLRTGEAARALVASHVVRSAPATLRGELYAFALGYPGVVDGDGAVAGELLWLADLAAALPVLDAYEGDDFARVV